MGTSRFLHPHSEVPIATTRLGNAPRLGAAGGTKAPRHIARNLAGGAHGKPLGPAVSRRWQAKRPPAEKGEEKKLGFGDSRPVKWGIDDYPCQSA